MSRILRPPPLRLHRLLLAAHGPQGWWPLAGRPGAKSASSRGLDERDRVEICAGAVLTQNTNWRNVERALGGLRALLPRLSWRALAAAKPAALERAIRPSGYFRQKARKLQVLARRALSRGCDTAAWLSSGTLDGRREELLSLWGVGPETADAILLYAAGRPTFVVDAYTKRLGLRLGWWRREPGYEEARAALTRSLPRDAALYNEFHALVVRHAKEHCRAVPVCPGCPARRLCARPRLTRARPGG